MKKSSFICLLTIFGSLLLVTGCGKPDAPPAASGSGSPTTVQTIGVSFETLQTEFWVAALKAFETELARRHIRMLQAVADGDANRQIEQVRNFITRKVDGIIMVPKDARACIPVIKAANAANIPIVLFNRPPAESDAKSVAVVADNFTLARDTVAFLVAEARKAGGKYKALHLIGDLGDINAIGRRDGFDAAVSNATDVIEVVARVPTEWNNEKAYAGVVNALQKHPDIRLIFTPSDLHLPSIASALRNAGKWHKRGEPGHVLLAGFDGDATAYQMLVDGYLDATGVQDVYFEVEASIQAVLDARAGKPVPPTILDPGFVIHAGNLEEKAARMWGAKKK
ncbi:MAG: sugar ABC transporter substrate-binding protein [Verrucomicrobia bacterium]|nr:sugar ABC transporter substrate-binding protein [Verrucomicrobiota bacterium]